jgi:hypothetical protein
LRKPAGRMNNQIPNASMFGPSRLTANCAN